MSFTLLMFFNNLIVKRKITAALDYMIYINYRQEQTFERSLHIKSTAMGKQVVQFKSYYMKLGIFL